MLYLKNWYFDDDGSKSGREGLLRLLDWFLRPFENLDDGGVFRCQNEGVLLTGEIEVSHEKGVIKIIDWYKVKESITSIGLTTDRHHGERPMIVINTPKGVFFVYQEDYKGVVPKARLE